MTTPFQNPERMKTSVPVRLVLGGLLMLMEKTVYGVVFAAAAHAAGLPGFGFSPCSPDQLGRAHMAYVRGDYQNMTVAIKELFEKNPADRGVQKNAMELIEKTYEVLEDKPMPVDWDLPESVRGLQLILRRDNSATQVRDSLELRGFQKMDVKFKTLRLVRHPRQLLLDLKEDDFEREPEELALSRARAKGQEEPSVWREFSLSRALPKGPQEGLYFLEMELADGTSKTVWFLLSRPQESEELAHSQEIEKLARMGWVNPREMRMNSRKSRSFGALRIQWETQSVVRFLER